MCDTTWDMGETFMGETKERADHRAKEGRPKGPTTGLLPGAAPAGDVWSDTGATEAMGAASRLSRLLEKPLHLGCYTGERWKGRAASGRAVYQMQLYLIDELLIHNTKGGQSTRCSRSRVLRFIIVLPHGVESLFSYL